MGSPLETGAKIMLYSTLYVPSSQLLWTELYPLKFMLKPYLLPSMMVFGDEAFGGN